MTPASYDITIWQGASFATRFTYKNDGEPVDLTGYTARMHLRETYTSAAPAVELTTENGRLTVGGPAGTIVATLTAAETAQLKARGYVYDLELVIGTAVVRLLHGTATVDPEATK